MPISRLIVFIAGNFFVATSFMSVPGLLNEIADSLHVSIEKAGLLMTAFGITAALCAPVLATLGSRIDRRALLTGAMIVCGIGCIGSALSDSYDHLLWARILAATAAAVYSPQVAATVSMMVPENERAATLGKLMVGWGLGAVVGNPLAVLIGSWFGWRVSFGCIGVASGLIAIFIWFSIPAGVRVAPLSLDRWYQVLQSPSLRWLTGAAVFNAMSNSLMMSFLAPMARAVQGASAKMIAALFFVTGVGGIIGNTVVIRMVRKLGAASVANRCHLAAASMLFLWTLASGSLIGMFVAQFLWSVGNAGFPTVQQARLVEVAPTLAAATIALNSSCIYLGSAAGASTGSAAWALIQPRFLPWVAMIFIFVALTCSIRGEKSLRQAQPA